MAESNNVMLMVALSWITLTNAQQMTINEANPPCEAPLVWEGQTGKLKFFYRPEAFSSEAFFAILKRADNPGKDIIVCTTRLGIKCNVSSPQYNLHSVTNHSLTVLIPRITKDFEDTYLLLTYTEGTLAPTDACRLVVKANKETCDNPAVLEGQIGKLTFFLRPDILAFEDFFATLRRAITPGRDILVCTRKSPINCHIASPHLYQSNGIVDDTLTLLIPNVSRTFEDTYVLKVYANGSSRQFDACSLHVKGQITDTVTGDENVSKGWIPALIMCLFLLLMIGIGLLVWKRNPDCLQKCMRRLKADQNQQKATSKRLNEQEQGETTTTSKLLPTQQTQNLCPPSNKNHDEPDTPKPEDQEQQKSVTGTTPRHVPPPKPGITSSLSDKTPIEREQIISHEGMRWFVGNRSDDEVKNLFECVKPRAGHFVITQSKADLSSFTLFVCWKGWKDLPKVDRFYITHNDSGFTVNIPNTHFDTLCELVKVYRTNPMRVGGKVLGTLSKPCEEEPNDAWYFGSLSGDKVGKLLFTMHTEEGSFVVTKSSTNEDNYTLSVKFGGKLVPFTIVPRDDGFKITHLTGSFMTLKKLVEHYRKNDLDGLGTLKKSLEIIPEKLSTEEKQILEKNGPCSYFFKDSSIPSRRVLAVNANGEMKQLMIIKSNDGYKLADHGILHRDEAALELYYRTKEITLHGDRYGYLRKNCTHDLETN